MDEPFDVKIRVGGKLAKLQAIASGKKPEVLQRIMTQWMRIFTSFIQRRFNTFSRGGGDWPALALSTVAQRRKGKGRADRSSLARDTKDRGKLVPAGGTYTILRDSSLLFKNLVLGELTPIVKGQNVFRASASFGGPTRYPKGDVTVTDVMTFHQRGGTHLPQRKIIVDPDDRTLELAATAGKRILVEELNSGNEDDDYED